MCVHIKQELELGFVSHTLNHSTCEAEANGSLQVEGQSRLHSKLPSQKEKESKNHT